MSEPSLPLLLIRALESSFRATGIRPWIGTDSSVAFANWCD